MNMITIEETFELYNDKDNDALARFIVLHGKRHLQMMGRSHAAMPPTWRDGVIMTCPDTLTSKDVVADPDRFYRGYGDGCEILTDISSDDLAYISDAIEEIVKS